MIWQSFQTNLSVNATLSYGSVLVLSFSEISLLELWVRYIVASFSAVAGNPSNCKIFISLLLLRGIWVDRLIKFEIFWCSPPRFTKPERVCNTDDYLSEAANDIFKVFQLILAALRLLNLLQLLATAFRFSFQRFENNFKTGWYWQFTKKQKLVRYRSIVGTYQSPALVCDWYQFSLWKFSLLPMQCHLFGNTYICFPFYYVISYKYWSVS